MWVMGEGERGLEEMEVWGREMGMGEKGVWVERVWKGEDMGGKVGREMG